MAEEAPALQNKKLILVAVLLGVAVVVLYNIHISRIRRQVEGGKVKLLRVNRDIRAGEEVTAKDVDVVAVPENFADNLGAPIRAEERDVLPYVVNRSLQKDQYLLWSHITGGDENRPSAAISDEKVAVALELDPKLSPGDILRVGDRVNVLGYLPAKGGGYETYRIIKGVKVHTIGGVGRSEATGSGRASGGSVGRRSYDSVTIELPPDESIKLYNVLSHVRGGRVWLELLNPGSLPSDREEVNPELPDLTAKAAAAS